MKFGLSHDHVIFWDRLINESNELNIFAFIYHFES